MKVILLKDVAKLGNKGDIKDVSPNFARNVLLKSRQAALATSDNLKKLESQKAKIEKERSAKEAALAKAAKQLSTITLSLTEKANEKGTLFAGVDAKKLAHALKKDHGINLETSHILLKEAIKEAGTYQIGFKLPPAQTGSFTLIIKV